MGEAASTRGCPKGTIVGGGGLSGGGGSEDMRRDNENPVWASQSQGGWWFRFKEPARDLTLRRESK